MKKISQYSRRFQTQFNIPNYNASGGDGFYESVSGLRRNFAGKDVPVVCQWKIDINMGHALVDQWGFAHQWSA